MGSLRVEQEQGECPRPSAPPSTPCALQRGDLFQPTSMALRARELRGQEDVQQVGGQLRPDHPCTECDDVHIIVLDTLTGRERVVTQRTAYTGELARRNAGTDSTAAHDDAAIGRSARDRAA